MQRTSAETVSKSICACPLEANEIEVFWVGADSQDLVRAAMAEGQLFAMKSTPKSGRKDQ